MVIELKPEQERILQEALRQGRFHSMEEAVDEAIRSIASPGATSTRTRPPGKKSLAQLFAESPFKGLSMEFERFPDTLPPVEP